jgi:hypothetical protein
MTMPQAFRLLDARSRRVQRQQDDEEQRRNNPDGLTDAELRRKHAEANSEDGAVPYDELIRSLQLGG